MLDVLVFGPHPDDAELGAGGSIAKAIKQGLKVGIIDLTAGEMGTHGTPEKRFEESKVAAKVLGVKIRENIGLPDGHLTFKIDKETIFLIANKIRQYQPKAILVPFWEDRHPDHIAASQIITKAQHYAKLKKVELDYPNFLVDTIIYYEVNGQFKPSYIMDISEEFTIKKNAIMSHKSQFKEFTKDYLPFPVFERCQYYGTLIEVDFGEAFLIKKPLKLNNWLELLD
ncbi:MAG: bacillithiol biosynthesis deacetylase BshB1 [Asgard group archaeon]|nr:bacillithiol biosynthesis deacetylase BshB1 [Asgard group archaeon]